MKKNSIKKRNLIAIVGRFLSQCVAIFQIQRDLSQFSISRLPTEIIFFRKIRRCSKKGSSLFLFFQTVIQYFVANNVPVHGKFLQRDWLRDMAFLSNTVQKRVNSMKNQAN